MQYKIAPKKGYEAMNDSIKGRIPRRQGPHIKMEQSTRTYRFSWEITTLSKVANFWGNDTGLRPLLLKVRRLGVTENAPKKYNMIGSEI